MGTEENVEQQRALYGEPLGVLVPRVAAALGLSQAATARVQGLSPAMLSHLVTGQRVKIANPAALSRLQALVELSRAAPELAPNEVTDRLDRAGDGAPSSGNLFVRRRDADEHQHGRADG